MNQKITWGSHIPVHEALIDTYEVKGVLELGAGFHSTSFFFENCDYVTSIETDAEWVDKLRASLKEDEKRRLILHPISNDITRSTRRHDVSEEFLKDVVTFWNQHINKDINYLFIDSISSLRLEALEKLKSKFDIIVFHDVNPRGLKNHYGEDVFDKLKKLKSYSLFVDETYTQYTGILISNKLANFDEFEHNHKIRVKNYSSHEAKLIKW